MRVAGAAVAGAGHLANGRGCQDAFNPVDLGEWAVLAVADGVGSSERSALGAHIAVDATCRLLAGDPPAPSAGADDWSRWIASRGAAVVDEYLRIVTAVVGRAADMGALAATLVAAVVRPPWVAFLSVGDGFGVVLTREADRSRPPERCHLVLPPPLPGGPPAGSLASPGARLRVRTFALWEPELSGVVLATDGCIPLALDHPFLRGLPVQVGPLPSERFFGGIATGLRADGGDAHSLSALLSSSAAARTGDDRTVLCALLEGPSA